MFRKLALSLLLPSLIFFVFAVAVLPTQASATEISKMGVHILHPREVIDAKDLFNEIDSISLRGERWHYTTVPYTLDDIENHKEWQDFFDQAKAQKIIPIVRLMTRPIDGYWAVPTRKEIVDQLESLNSLQWPTNERLIIIYNEPNHANEWGGRVDPESYASAFKFASAWAHVINPSFVVMMGGMDLDAPNGYQTMEAFAFMDRMYQFDKNIFRYIDALNSHSYPNPGFSALPTKSAKNGIDGYKYELKYLEGKVSRNLQVYITETGWKNTSWIGSRLAQYYLTAFTEVWSDSKVEAVTPFVLRGAPGPFAGFSFYDENGNKTAQYHAYTAATVGRGF